MMTLLTGKAEASFKKWLTALKYSGPAKHNSLYNRFTDLPQSMQWGVYQDWAETVNVFFTIIPTWKEGVRTYRVGYHFIKGDIINAGFLRPEKDSPIFIEYSELEEARTAAIEKLNELIHEK
jgi:hypothetical protein